LEKAKIFMNGRSQAVRLPKKFRFKGSEVYIKKTEEGVLLIPKNNSIWDVWEKNLIKYNNRFIDDRNQPDLQQGRSDLDEIFD
jgi:antitoxin VapB